MRQEHHLSKHVNNWVTSSLTHVPLLERDADSCLVHFWPVLSDVRPGNVMDMYQLVCYI